MEQFEMVEKLKTKAGVTAEEAKKALEENGWDMLESFLYLEKQTKGENNPNSYSTYYNYYVEEKCKKGKGSFGDVIRKIFKFLAKIIKIGNENNFEIERKGEHLLKMPINVLVLLLIFAFWMVFPLMILGLFLDTKYYFTGPLFANKNVNDVMENASSHINKVKEDIKRKHQEHKEKNASDVEFKVEDEK